MKSAFIFGYPKCCCNTNCKAIFTKECHLGWLPKTDTEIYAIMQCEKCKSKFKVAQFVGEADNYFNRLPRIEIQKPTTSITMDEIKKIKRALSENINVLKELNAGMIPGVSNNLKPND